MGSVQVLLHCYHGVAQENPGVSNLAPGSPILALHLLSHHTLPSPPPKYCEARCPLPLAQPHPIPAYVVSATPLQPPSSVPRIPLVLGEAPTTQGAPIKGPPPPGHHPLRRHQICFLPRPAQPQETHLGIFSPLPISNSGSLTLISHKCSGRIKIGETMPL